MVRARGAELLHRRIEQGDVLTVNGRNVLCFDATLAYEIKTVKGAGMPAAACSTVSSAATGSSA